MCLPRTIPAKKSMIKSERIRLPVWIALLVLFSGLAGGCRPDSGSADRSPDTGSTLQLLPTPTLAVPGSVDPFNPPTPIVYPSPTPAGAAPDDSTGIGEATGIDTASAPPTPQPVATVALPDGATPMELLDLGRRSAAEGDHDLAAAAFGAVVNEPGDLDAALVSEAHLGLAVALLANGQTDRAALELEALVQTSPAVPDAGSKGVTLPATVNIADVATFHLGQARATLGDHAGAIAVYEAYLANNPDMAAYIQPLIADSFEALGDNDAVIAALAGSVDAPSQRFKAVANRSRLAALYLARGDYDAAIAQYDAIHDIARTEATKGQMTYLAGQAEIMAGNTAAGHERFVEAITNYPRAIESYYALVALIEAGVPVDEYQRGVVDYYAGAYQPAIDAFRRYIAAEPEIYDADAHAFLAWSHEALGNQEGALSELDALRGRDPARALFERGELLRRAGMDSEALAAYDELLKTYPEMEGAAGVAWTAAKLADSLGLDDARKRYLFLADSFPFDENTPAALFRAADLADAAGKPDEALTLRSRLIEQYPANVNAAEALFRLLQAAEAGDNAGPDAAALAAQVATLSPSNYFALRAADFVAGTPPFTAETSFVMPDDIEAGRAEAEAWLRERLTAQGLVVPDGDLGAMTGAPAADPQRIIGEKLWQLGLQEAAKAELETVREAYADDPLANYRMARYFSQLGLYRSSIIAAATLLQQTEATVFDAPLYLGRLSYPPYFADLILPLADRFGFDPRLQFALVRQESLFESFARSGAAAQGLSQVIPDTGAWIAQRLAWPNYENDDLYKPYVGLNFGAYYLSEQLRNFDGHVHAALAAYNGGPGNAARWFDVAGGNHDLFVDTVDFPETRLYIERIYEGFNAYRYLYSTP